MLQEKSLIRGIFLAATIFIVHVNKGNSQNLRKILKNNYVWQILYSNDSKQIVLFNNQEFYSYYSEYFFDKYKIHDSVKNDRLVMSNSQLHYRSYEYYENNSSQKKILFKDLGVKYRIISLDEQKNLIFYLNGQVFGIYHLDKIEIGDDSLFGCKPILLFFDRIVDIPIKTQ